MQGCVFVGCVHICALSHCIIYWCICVECVHVQRCICMCRLYVSAGEVGWMLSVSHLLSIFNLHDQPVSRWQHTFCVRKQPWGTQVACHGLAAHEGEALTQTQLGRLGTDP